MIMRGNLYSQALQMETGVVAIAPDKSGKPPGKTIYLLHGLTGACGDWTDFTALPARAEEYDALFIMPEAGRSFYMDQKNGGNYFSYIADELPDLVRRVFRVSAKREDTVVAGCSMGGFGALKCALSRPGTFGWCCAFSSACLFLKDDLEKNRAHFLERYGEPIFRDFSAILGEDLAWRPDMELLELAKHTARLPEKPAVYAACGEGDPFLTDNARFKRELEGLGYDLIYEELPGEHNWAFFDKALHRALARVFRQSA